MNDNRRGFLAAMLALAAAPALARFKPTEVAVAIAPGRYLNILDFGADPTGRTSSSKALRAALDAAKGGGVVYFPRGTYSLTEPMRGDWMEQT